MQGIRIVATGRALPAKIMTNEELSRTMDTSDEWIRTRTGIGQRYFCEEETCTGLIVSACEKAMKGAGVDPEQISAVIVATVTPDLAFPAVACMVQKELGLGQDVMAFDISAGCTGFLYGIGIARGLLAAGKKKYALVAGGEQLSRIIDFKDRSTAVLFGDGAGAALIALEEMEENEFDYYAWSDGEAGPLNCVGLGHPDPHIRMEGSQVFKFAVKAIDQGIRTILKNRNLTMDDIDYVVCHQANRRIVEHAKRKYEGTKAQFVMNMETYANTSAASIPIALDEMFERKALKPGMKIICVGFGAGFTWSSALFTIG